MFTILQTKTDIHLLTLWKAQKNLTHLTSVCMAKTIPKDTLRQAKTVWMQNTVLTVAAELPMTLNIALNVAKNYLFKPTNVYIFSKRKEKLK